jgi:hypothetical protein
MWFWANWDSISIPANVVVWKVGTPIMPALLMRTSNVDMAEVMADAAAWMEEKEERSRGMKIAAVVGLIDLISWITGFILDEVRPRRKIAFGLPKARERAVWAPMLPLLGPVMMTGGC